MCLLCLDVLVMLRKYLSVNALQPAACHGFCQKPVTEGKSILSIVNNAWGFDAKHPIWELRYSRLAMESAQISVVHRGAAKTIMRYQSISTWFYWHDCFEDLVLLAVGMPNHWPGIQGPLHAEKHSNMRSNTHTRSDLSECGNQTNLMEINVCLFMLPVVS